MANQLTKVEIVKSHKCDGTEIYGVQWKNGQVYWADNKPAAKLLAEIAVSAQADIDK